MNQNSEIQVTANSIIPDMMAQSYSTKNIEIFQNFPDNDSFNSVMRGIIPNYYKNWKSKYIIDRSTWGLRGNLSLLQKYHQNEIKIIVLVRPLLEVLSSFIIFSNKTKDNFITRNADTIENKCKFLLSPNGHLDKMIRGIQHLQRPENKKYAHFIDYDDLVNNTKKEIEGAYDFLDIPKFDHRFTNLDQLSNNGIIYNDSILGGELHKIRTNKIVKSDYQVSDILPDHVIEKYRNYSIGN